MKSNNHNRTDDWQQDPSERNYRNNHDHNYGSSYNTYGREYNSGQTQDSSRERTNSLGRPDADNHYKSRSPYENSNAYSSRYNDQASEYQGRDKGPDKNERNRNSYASNDFDRYKNYEGNSGRGNYQDYDGPSRYTGNETNNNPTRYSEKSGRDWDSRESGYYNGASTSRHENKRAYPYGDSRSQDGRDWANGRNQNFSYLPERSEERYADDRNIFGRMGDSIKNTWHNLTDRDDTQENMQRFNQRNRSYNPESNYSKGQSRPFYSPDNYNDSRYKRQDEYTQRGSYEDYSRDRDRYGNDSYMNW